MIFFCEFDAILISTFISLYKNLLLLNSRRVHVSCVLETCRLYAVVFQCSFLCRFTDVSLTTLQFAPAFFCVLEVLLLESMLYIFTMYTIHEQFKYYQLEETR